jgi:hypothetical protein
MLKLNEAADLEKAAKSLGGYFTKQAEEVEKSHTFHKSMASQHEALHKAHKAHADHNKSVHDSLENDHSLKGHFGKAADHENQLASNHEECAKACTAQAEAMKTQLDALKALASEWGNVPALKAAGGTIELPNSAPSGNIIADMIQQTTASMTKKTLESMNTDPEVQGFIKETITKMVADALAGQIVPGGPSKVAPRPSITPVSRPGQKELAEAQKGVPIEFAKLVAIEEDEEDIRVGQLG